MVVTIGPVRVMGTGVAVILHVEEVVVSLCFVKIVTNFLNSTMQSEFINLCYL